MQHQNFWLKTCQSHSFPKLLTGSIHQVTDNQLLLTVLSPPKFAIYFLNHFNLSVDNKFVPTFSNCRTFDLAFLHPRNILLSRRLYLFKNTQPEIDDEQVLLIDLDNLQEDILPIKMDQFRPQRQKINYTIERTNEFEIVRFGGIDIREYKLLNEVELFNVTTYRWSQLQTFGKSPEPRQGHTMIVNNGLIYIIGGTQMMDLFQVENENNFCQALFILELKTATWREIQTSPQNQIPTWLVYSPDPIQFSNQNNEREIFLFWSDRPNSNLTMKLSKLNLSTGL